jgi:hypothetical protein
LAGGGDNNGQGIAVDASGDVYVTGSTTSADFPTTPGAFQTSFGGYYDAFVSKLNASGSALLYSTYLGGSGYDYGNGIALDASGNAYVTGDTTSSDFPTTPGAFQATYGGNGDAFVSKLNASGSALIYSTYLGGGSNDGGSGIAVDAPGSVTVTGTTACVGQPCLPGTNDFPTTAGAFQTSFAGGSEDAFVSKLNAAGSALVYSTYLGGSGGAGGSGIAVDASGSVYIIGTTFCISQPCPPGTDDFPTTPGAFQTSFAGSSEDAFVSKLNPAGTALAAAQK